MTQPDELRSGDVLWAPTADQVAFPRLAAYMRWLESSKDLHFDGYQALWQWSVDEVETFWQSVWDYFDVRADGSREPVLASRDMPGARWYPETRLNYVEHVFRNASADRPALIARSEDEAVREVSWAELERLTVALAARLRAIGVGPGDRVASYLPNRPETVVAFLACASIGAIWSSCAPDMGATVVLDRFRQIEPKVLFATDSDSYNGRCHERTAVVEELVRELPSVQVVVHVAGPGWRATATPEWQGCVAWRDVVAQEAPLSFQRVPFSHPLWIVYSSGTTGLPKAIVHSHGGIVLTHLKTMALHMIFVPVTGCCSWAALAGSSGICRSAGCSSARASSCTTATRRGQTQKHFGASSTRSR